VRILHAPRNTANQPGYTVRALRQLGHDAEVWEYGDNPFGFPVDRTIRLDEHDPAIFMRAFEEAIDRFDIFHFHFGRSLFPNQWGGIPAFWDLPMYRALGKRVFFTFHGSDCRIRRLHEQMNPWSYYRFADVPADDDRTAKVIEIIRTYANRMFVVSSDYLVFVPEATVMPRVIDLSEWPEQPVEQPSAPSILHIPSHRGTKGTQFIEAGLAQLKEQGVSFSFRLVEGVTHAEARRAIQEADVVIDNVVTGDYELVSIEAMASGKVAVANIQGGAREAFPDAPIYSVDPDSFVTRIRDLLEDRDLRAALAAQGRAYVKQVHDAAVVATALAEAYESTEPTFPHRSFPDWASLDDARRIERLEARVAMLEQSLARTRRESTILRKRLGLSPETPVPLGWKDRIPAPIRQSVRRLRGWAKRAMGSTRRRGA
jgi:hypothetical protein